MDNSIKYINLNELIPGEFQPHIEETKSSLENLTNSIKNHGIIIPLIVRPKGIQYEIILGNRRYNAARILRIEKVPVIILDIDDTKAINLIISDNIQRKELTGREEGYRYLPEVSERWTEYEGLSALWETQYPWPGWYDDPGRLSVGRSFRSETGHTDRTLWSLWKRFWSIYGGLYSVSIGCGCDQPAEEEV